MKIFALMVLLSGCTLEYDGQSAAFPLTGTEPARASFDQINTVVVGLPKLMTGADGATWVAFCEFWDAGSGNNAAACKKEHLVELGTGTGDEVIEADGFSLRNTELYELRDDPNGGTTRTITLHRPGDPILSDVTFTVAGGTSTLTVDPGDSDVFTYFTPAGTAPATFTLFRRDGAMHALPAGEAVPAQTRFLADGSVAVVIDNEDQMTAYDTVTGTPTPIATAALTGYALIDDTNRAVITETLGGLVSSPIDGSAPRTLTTARPTTSTIVLHDTTLYYVDAGDLWQVPLDGSAPASVAQASAARLWAVGPLGQLMYSHDDALEYSGAAGDGYIGAQPIMERGRVIHFSTDDVHVRYLEHAATLGTYGDLTSFALPGGPPVTLAINTHDYAELPDHRVLAVEDAVYRGDWNRLVVIDEAAGTKHWVVPSAADFLLVPDGSELIADVVSGASGYDLFRVPSPAP